MDLTYFDFLRIIFSNWGVLFLLAGLAISFIGAWNVVAALRQRGANGSKLRLLGAVLLLVGGLFWSYLQTLIPTRYAMNPTRAAFAEAQTTESVRALYNEHCAVCHGDSGRGDGPLAPFLTPPPADFAIHGWHHREGEHYWWISRGIPGTGMPSFSSVLTEEERWMLARFVKQLGREARLQ